MATSDALANIDVMILCGGKGTRLAPVIGHDIPKCLAPINGVPFLTRLTWKLSDFGARSFVLCTGHLHSEVMGWLNDLTPYYRTTKEPGLCNFSIKESAYGPMVAAAVACDHMSFDRALVINGDTWFEGDLGTIVEAITEDPSIYWKPTHPNHSYEFKLHGKSTGIYVFPKEVLANPVVAVHQVEILIPFSILDIGTPEGYAEAQRTIR